MQSHINSYKNYSPSKSSNYEKVRTRTIEEIIRNPIDVDIEDLRRLQMTGRLDEQTAESILKNALQLTLIPTERNRAWRVLMQLAQEDRDLILRVCKKPNFFYEFLHDVFMNFKTWSTDDSQAGVALFQSIVTKLDLRSLRFIRDHEASLVDSQHHELKMNGREAIDYIVKEMESLLRLSRAKGMLSEDDLDKATCWVHDISDVVNLHEVAALAREKDIKNKDINAEVKMLKRDLENCSEMLRKSELNEKDLKSENMQLKSEMDKMKQNLDENLRFTANLERENDRLKNKINKAHSELKLKVDTLLLD